MDPQAAKQEIFQTLHVWWKQQQLIKRTLFHQVFPFYRLDNKVFGCHCINSFRGVFIDGPNNCWFEHFDKLVFILGSAFLRKQSQATDYRHFRKCSFISKLWIVFLGCQHANLLFVCVATSYGTSVSHTWGTFWGILKEPFFWYLQIVALCAKKKK